MSQPGSRRGAGAPSCSPAPAATRRSAPGRRRRRCRSRPAALDRRDVAAAASSMCTNDHTPGRRRRSGTCACAPARSARRPRRSTCRGRRSRRSAGRSPRAPRPSPRLEVADRGERLARVGRRLGVERVVLGLDPRAVARVRPAREALPHEPAGAGRPRGGDQVVGALDAQAVGEREALSKLRVSPGPARAVSWWTTTSGCAAATASRTRAASSGSTTTGSAPSARSSSAARCGWCR